MDEGIFGKDETRMNVLYYLRLDCWCIYAWKSLGIPGWIINEQKTRIKNATNQNHVLLLFYLKN